MNQTIYGYLNNIGVNSIKLNYVKSALKMFTLADLGVLNREDFVDIGKDNLSHAILRTFLPYLEKFFSERDDYKDYENPYEHHESYEDLEKMLKTSIFKGVLNLKRKISSQRFSNCDYIHTIDEFNEKIKNASADLLELLKTVNNVNLSFCFLLSSDIEKVFKFIVDLHNISNNKMIINLSNNYFENETEFLYKLLDLEFILLVDIRGTALSTLECKNFLRSLELARLSKLIFVSPLWIEAGEWKNVISEDLHDVVRESHERYFALTF